MLQSTFPRKITDNVIYNLRNRKMFMSQTVEKESKNGKNFDINLLTLEESKIYLEIGQLEKEIKEIDESKDKYLVTHKKIQEELSSELD